MSSYGGPPRGTCHCRGPCVEAVNLSKIRGGVRPFPYYPTTWSSARKREIESLSTHLLENDKCEEKVFLTTYGQGRHPPSGFGFLETIRQGGCGSNTAAAQAPLPRP